MFNIIANNKSIATMMIIIIVAIDFNTSKGQNLVFNSGFEIADTCPNNQGNINLAHGWFNANTVFPSTTDYYHLCSPLAGLTPPSIFTGYQNAHFGDAFIGMGVYTLGLSNSREYAETELLDTLTGGEIYYVEFYAVLGNSLNLAISNLGAYLTNSILINNNFTVISVLPQIENPDTIYLNDTLNWMKISGTFTAVGGEKFITIGNFRDDLLTNDTVLSQDSTFYNYCYYYIDDIIVMPLDSLQGLDEPISNLSVNVYPNPAKEWLTLDFNSNIQKQLNVSLFSIDGKEIKTWSEKYTSKMYITLPQLSNGIYFLKIRNGAGEVVRKVVIN
jgi:hypothetical protein